MQSFKFVCFKICNDPITTRYHIKTEKQDFLWDSHLKKKDPQKYASCLDADKLNRNKFNNINRNRANQALNS